MAIFLNHQLRIIHACKSNNELGVGITKCGITFLIGAYGYIADGSFSPESAPEDAAEDKEPWAPCACCQNTPYSKNKNRWYRWKEAMAKTLVLMGLREPVAAPPESPCP